MTWEIIFVAALTIAALISFIWEKIRIDLTSITLLVIIMVVSLATKSPRLPDISEILSVFSNPAPLSIAAMLIITAALEKCGVIESTTALLERFTLLGYKGLLGSIVLCAGIVSMFLNNTAVVVMFVPIVLSLAKKVDKPASKFLIPLSHASVFGGCCTAIGTSTNLVVSGILESRGLEPFGMFELSYVGIPIFLVATLYLVLFSDKLLPVRETISSLLSEDERKEYITEAFVSKGSKLIGLSLKDSGLLKISGMRTLEIVRNSISIEIEHFEQIIIQEGDRLVLACRPSAMMAARNLEGINFSDQMGLGLEQISASEASIVEGVIGPRSAIIGKTIHEVNFRQRFRMVLLAVHRRGASLRERLRILRFEFGDTLLMLGTDQAIENLRKSDEILLLDKPAIPAENMKRKMPIAVGIFAGVVLLNAFEILPLIVSAIIGAALVFWTGCLKPKDWYRPIEWSILVLIYGTLALGICMEKSGFAALLAEYMVKSTEHFVGSGMKPYVLLAAIYLCTMILTEVLSNNATAALMAPLALWLGLTLGVDSRPFVIAVTIAASAAFCTPIGYQTNTYVYGIGGYRFGDFFNIGVFLNIIYFVGSILLIPLFWPF